MRHTLPFAPPGSRVGLFGGSFDPVHSGHVALSQAALRSLRLDRVWWLVTPGNPLKQLDPAPLSARMAAARVATGHDPRVCITDIESRLGTCQTARTLAALQRQYPRVRFVWLMGADAMAGLHRWHDWRRIVRSVPIAVFARPGDRLPALGSRAARIYARNRIKPHDAHGLADAKPPAWCFLNIPMVEQSSTLLRQRR